MTKKQMKKDLIKEMQKRLPVLEFMDALVLLNQFERVFEIREYARNAPKWKKWYYYAIGYAAALDGFIRDVRVNSTVGRRLFGKYSIKDGYFGLSTLTGTMIRVKKAGKGGAAAPNYALALQICAVLNNYDEGHC